MADDVSVIGPVRIEPTSREHVAFNLMNHIATKESMNGESSRQYWLTLYGQCLQAVCGKSPEPDRKEG